MADNQTQKTEITAEDQATYLDQWRTLKSMTTRAEKNTALVGIFHGIQLKPPHQLSSYERGLLHIFEGECMHQLHVNRVLQKVGLYRCHDWSKDYYMFFILTGVHHFHINNKEFDKERQVEYDRHFEAEPHHPEFEKKSGKINVLDLQEMAVDRMSRNVFRTNGEVSLELLDKYQPIFCGDKPEEKLAIFNSFVKELAELVKQVYHEIQQERSEVKAVRTLYNMSV